jgi:hypothetical protein
MLKNKIQFILLIICIFLIPKPLWADSSNVWIDTSRWEVRDVWVSSGYWQKVEKKVWVDTSYTVQQGHWQIGEYSVWVPQVITIAYQDRVWIDTSRWENVSVWVNQPYQVWVKSGYYRNTWVRSGYYQTITRRVWVTSGYYKQEPYQVWEIRKEPNWGINRVNPVHGSGGYAVLVTKYRRVWVDTSHWRTTTERIWIDTSHWQTQYIDTSKWETRYRLVLVNERRWVSSGYWQNITRYRTVNSGRWETRYGQYWVDTSYRVNQGYWRTVIVDEWVDTGRYEQQRVYIPGGYYTTAMKGEIIIEKNPKYVFTRWHKDVHGNEASMELKVKWKIYNADLADGEEKKEIIRLYIYQDVVRYNEKGIDKVVIFNGSVHPSEEGYIETVTKFDYSGSEESMLHIYLYSQSGHVGHVSLSNPINGFRSININDHHAGPNYDIWLGGRDYEILYF